MTKIKTSVYANVVMGVLLAVSAPASGQTPSLWTGLEPGPHGIGFKTIEVFDYSRSFQSARDYFGAPLASEPGRPIQICYWYPAVAHDAVPMTYGEYSFPYPADSRLFSLLSNLQNRDIGLIFATIGNNQGLAAQIMNYRLKAVRDASPAEGTFPLIVYHGSERGGYNQNVVLCEYLASHGFVVTTTPALGAAMINASEQAWDIEAVTRDKEVAVATLRELSFVDTETLGLIGYNYGITTALIHQMRNFDVDAVASLQSRYQKAVNETALHQSDSYNPDRMRAPSMVLYPETPDQTANLSLLDSLRYSTRYGVRLFEVRPAEFSVYGIIGAVGGVDSTRTIEAAGQAQAVLGQYLWRFFDATLNDNQASRDWLDSQPGDVGQVGEGTVFSRYEAERLPPSGDQFLAVVQTYGLARARELCETFKIPTAETPLLEDAAWTQLGYQFLMSGDVPSALQVFAWGVAAWPGSANAWDSYGEATAASGDPAAALERYRRALEILPNDTAIAPNMRTQLETSIPANVLRLEQEVAAAGNSGGANQ